MSDENFVPESEEDISDESSEEIVEEESSESSEESSEESTEESSESEDVTEESSEESESFSEESEETVIPGKEAPLPFLSVPEDDLLTESMSELLVDQVNTLHVIQEQNSILISIMLIIVVVGLLNYVYKFFKIFF